MYKENEASHRQEVGKRKNILIASQIIMDIFLWYNYKTQQVVIPSRLVIVWNLNSYQWAFFYTVTLKIHWFVLHFDGPFTHVWFYNIMHWPLGKHWFNELCRFFQMLTHLIIQYLKITFVNIATNLIKKWLVIEKLSSLPWQMQVF